MLILQRSLCNFQLDKSWKLNLSYLLGEWAGVAIQILPRPDIQEINQEESIIDDTKLIITKANSTFFTYVLGHQISCKLHILTLPRPKMQEIDDEYHGKNKPCKSEGLYAYVLCIVRIYTNGHIKKYIHIHIHILEIQKYVLQTLSSQT